MENNNIYLPKIKNILQNLRQLKYEDNNTLLLDISKITIDFSKTNIDLNEISFVIVLKKF